MVITWKTTKTEDGFRWTVYAFGYQQESKALKTGVARTRAVATRCAKQWSLYLKRDHTGAN